MEGARDSRSFRMPRSDPKNWPSHASIHLGDIAKGRLSTRKTHTHNRYTYKPSCSSLKVRRGRPVDRNAGRVPYPPEGQEVPERAKRTVGTKHQVPRRGKVHFERSRITALPFASLCPSLDHDRAIHFPASQPRGYYRIGSIRIDRGSALWVDHAV